MQEIEVTTREQLCTHRRILPSQRLGNLINSTAPVGNLMFLSCSNSFLTSRKRDEVTDPVVIGFKKKVSKGIQTIKHFDMRVLADSYKNLEQKNSWFQTENFCHAIGKKPAATEDSKWVRCKTQKISCK